MSTFLEKLKESEPGSSSASDADAKEDKGKEEPKEELPQGVLPLDIDMYRLDAKLYIAAQIPGATLGDTSVMLQGENDVIVIRGERRRPKTLEATAKKIEASSKSGETEQAMFEEAKWGSFYRRIVLPGKISPAEMRVELDNGVLFITLTLDTKLKSSGISTPNLKELLEAEMAQTAIPKQQSAPAVVQIPATVAPLADTVIPDAAQPHKDTIKKREKSAIEKWAALIKKTMHPAHKTNPGKAKIKRVGNTLVVEIPVENTGTTGISNISLKRAPTNKPKKKNKNAEEI